MKVNKAFEGPDGTVTFEGELSGVELAKTLEVGLSVLIKLGVLRPAKEEKPLVQTAI